MHAYNILTSFFCFGGTVLDIVTTQRQTKVDSVSLGSRSSVCVFVCVCARTCMPRLSRNTRVLPEVITSIKSLGPSLSCLSYCLSVHQLASLQDFAARLLDHLKWLQQVDCSAAADQTAGRHPTISSLCRGDEKKTSSRHRLLLLRGIHQFPPTPHPTPAYTPSNGPNDSDRGLSHADL